MKGRSLVDINVSSIPVFRSFIAILICFTSFAVFGQTASTPGPSPSVPDQSSAAPLQTMPANVERSVSNTSAAKDETPPGSPKPSSEEVQKRIEHARALAAAHQLQIAASELEIARKSAQEESVKGVTSIILMGIYLEEGNYARAESLLEETFRDRSAKDDASVRTYFALAGQAVNGSRAHLERYRNFGINVRESNLAAEALSDLNRLRSLLERMVAQAKEIIKDRQAYDSLALLEDVLGLRLSLARDSEDRMKWEEEYANARELLASSQTQVASLGAISSIATAKTILKTSATKPAVLTAATSSSGPVDKASIQAAETVTDKQSVPARELEEPAKNKVASAPSRVAEKEATDPAALRTISTGILNDRASKRVVPTYPLPAKTARIEGVVKVYVSIDENGKVARVLRSEGPVLLIQASEEASLRWRFHPTAVSGKTVRLNGYIEFDFSLGEISVKK